MFSLSDAPLLYNGLTIAESLRGITDEESFKKGSGKRQ